MTNSLRAIDGGAPVDLVFQSIGGSEKTNESFGIDLALLREARERRGEVAGPWHGR